MGVGYWPGMPESVPCPVCGLGHEPGRMDQWDPCMFSPKGLRFQKMQNSMSSRLEGRTISKLCGMLLAQLKEPEYIDDEFTDYLKQLHEESLKENDAP